MNKDEISKYEAKLRMIIGLSWLDLTKLTGCQAKCKIRKYSLSACRTVPVTWKHDWSSAFYLAPETTEVIKSEELWVFDIFDTVNGIGGAMGLFLGWSVLFLGSQLAKGVNKIIRNMMFYM